MHKKNITIIICVLFIVILHIVKNINIQQKDSNENNVFPLCANKYSTYNDSDCVRAFVDEMNYKAYSIGMKNTTWINPSGLGENNYTSYSVTTVTDLAKMIAFASSYHRLNHIWNKKDHNVRVKGKNPISIETSVASSSLENYYPILGGKTGGGDGYYTLVIMTEIDGVQVVGAIAEASSTDGRFQAMKQLFDAARTRIKGETPPANSVSSANCAIAFQLPNNPATYNTFEVLYAQNENKLTPPMSTTKIMTAIVALDYIVNTHKFIEIKDIDIVNTQGTSGSIFSVGDVVTIEDLLYAAMLPSSNQAANAIARYVGNEILKEKNFAK